MTTASVSVLKAKLSEYLDRVKRGDEISVTEYGKAVARIVPAPRRDDTDQAAAELVRAGRATPGRKGGIRPGVLRNFPLLNKGGGALKALLANRREDARRGYR
ncbi:MAG: type II toxin-antitoxin system prevent-host-death family antitoxin [bacterium]|mgnify:FL=1